MVEIPRGNYKGQPYIGTRIHLAIVIKKKIGEK